VERRGLGFHVRARLELDSAHVASHMLDCELFGLSSGAHHFTNVALHGIGALLLFGLLRRMTGARWRSAFGAFAFALHPLHVESVAWVAERKDVLSAVLFFLTLWVYVDYIERPSRGKYLLVALIFCCGLMAKPMVVTLPFVALLLDFWPLSPQARGRFGFRKAAAVRAGRWRLVGNVPGSKTRGRGRIHHPGSLLRASPECACLLRRVRGELRLARPAGGVLSVFDSAGWGMDGRRPRAGRGHHLGCARQGPLSLCGRRMALVFGHSGAGHWSGASRLAIPGGPLHLHTDGGDFDPAGMGRRRSGRAMALGKTALAAAAVALCSAWSIAAWFNVENWAKTASLCSGTPSRRRVGTMWPTIIWLSR